MVEAPRDLKRCLVDNEQEERAVATVLKKHLGAAGGLDVATGFFEVAGLLTREGDLRLRGMDEKQTA
jgi:hypothetical protein